MNKNSFAFASTAVLASLIGTAAAQAQSVDYGAAEQMFGEPVTTSATGTPQRVTDVPIDMTIVTAEQIKRSGVADIPTILSRVAGIDMLNWSAGSSDVSVRGYDQAYSPRLLVLINGRQVYLDYYGFTAWSTLPVQLDEIRQIEVVRGPNSALFGFNAVGGVVNIITYNPKFDDVDSLSAHAGSNGGYGGSAVGTLKLADILFLRASLGSEWQNEWTAGTSTTDYQRSKDNPWRLTASLDAMAQLTDDTELRLEGTWSKAGQNDMSPNYSLSGTNYRVWSAKAAVTSETEYGLIQLQAYYNKADALGGPFHFDNPVWVASAQDLFKLGADHTFRLGLEYRNNRMKTTAATGGTISYSVWAPSAMWNWAASPALSVSVAARLDTMSLNRDGTFPDGCPNADNALWDRTLTEISINAGAVYKASADDTLRLTYARGVQIPTLQDFGGLVSIMGRMGTANTGNPFVKPSIVSNYQISYDRSLAPLGALASVKLFYQTTQNVMSGFDATAASKTSSTYTLITIVNGGSSRMLGAELSASGKFAEGFRWSADWTYTHVENHAQSDLDLDLLQIDFAESTPKHRGNVALGWSGEHWDIDAYLHHVSRYALSYGVRRTPMEISTDGYANLDARIGYRLDDGWTIALGGQNLLQATQAQSSGFRAPRQVMFSIGKEF